MISHSQTSPSRGVQRPGDFINITLRLVRIWLRELQLRDSIQRERRQLMELSDDLLKDIGVSREDALAEAGRLDLPRERLNRI